MTCLSELDNSVLKAQLQMLCLSGEMLGQNLPRRIVEVWLNTGFADQERSKRLIRRIKAIEEGQDP